VTALTAVGMALAARTRPTREHQDDPWAPRWKAVDQDRIYRGRCPVCRRMVARATIGKVALEKLVRHGKRKGRPACKGSGMEPIRGGTR